MKFKFISAIAILLIFMVASAPANAQRKKHIVVADNDTPADESIRNGIKLKSKGFKVAEAYLVLDDETMVPQGNKVKLNQNVNMVLIIDTGWALAAGRVYPGSRQLIQLNTGEEILNSEDLFAPFDETGLPPEDAKYITLNSVVTNLKDKRKYAIINFRLWDKKGNSELSGSYKLHIQ